MSHARADRGHAGRRHQARRRRDRQRRQHAPAARRRLGADGWNVLGAPDGLKGTCSAAEVAAHIARGVGAGGREAVELPIADGGEGTMDALGGTVHTATVSDPLGRPAEARFALSEDGQSAIVEMAEASGLKLLAEDELQPWKASTRGTGELIAA